MDGEKAMAARETRFGQLWSLRMPWNLLGSSRLGDSARRRESRPIDNAHTTPSPIVDFLIDLRWRLSPSICAKQTQRGRRHQQNAVTAKTVGTTSRPLSRLCPWGPELDAVSPSAGSFAIFSRSARKLDNRCGPLSPKSCDDFGAPQRNDAQSSHPPESAFRLEKKRSALAGGCCFG